MESKGKRRDIDVNEIVNKAHQRANHIIRCFVFVVLFQAT